MSKEGVQLAIDKIAKDMVALARAIMEDDTIGAINKVNRNTLKGSALHKDVTAFVKSQTNADPVIEALFNNYVEYLEWDRPEKYGKQPPISTLKEWAASNGIPTDVNTLWAISYAIWRDGHKGRPIFATMDKELDGLFLDDWADKLFNSLVDNLDNFFNN